MPASRPTSTPTTTPSRSSVLRIRVPASTSNIGPGFDCLGCALKLYNVFDAQVVPGDPAGSLLEFEGAEAKGLVSTPDNVFFRAASLVLGQRRRRPVRWHVKVKVGVPNARGLGSSATAIVAGLIAGNQASGGEMTPAQLLELACRIEGHPDNVVAAMVGGLTGGVLAANGSLVYAQYKVHPTVGIVVASPDYEVATSKARAALPAQVPFADAVANTVRVPLVIEALRTGRLASLALLTEDRLHEPYRKPLYREFDALKQAALKAGAAAVTVSGAGPSMLAITPKADRARVASAMQKALGKLGLGGAARELDVAAAGADFKVV